MDTELLRRTDPIKYYEDVVLYEDELHDNGCLPMFGCESCRLASSSFGIGCGLTPCLRALKPESSTSLDRTMSFTHKTANPHGAKSWIKARRASVTQTSIRFSSKHTQPN
eukprot:08052_2